MLGPIKMVVFDMAGTTVNEQNVVYKTLHKAIEAHGIDVALATVLRLGAGKEKLQAIKDVLEQVAPDKLDRAAVIFEYFKSALTKAYNSLAVEPVTGVDLLLPKLRAAGIKVVLNTGYSGSIAQSLLQKLQWEQGREYDLLVTASDVVQSRPHPEMIELAMKTLLVEDPAQVLKAGDSAIDIEEGKNARCGVTVGVLSGAQTTAQLESVAPDFIIDSLIDLPALFAS